MKQIKDILERYWNCETALEEEKALRAQFLNGAAPEEVKNAQAAFLLQDRLAKEKADPTFIRKAMKAAITSDEQKQRNKISFSQILKVAASVLILISLGIGIQTYYRQAQFMEALFPETFTDPEDALQQTRIALDKVSSSFSRVQGILDIISPEQVADTLHSAIQDHSK
ncbi:MAG: hypothetical protein LBR67_06870 [Dysgonamonadaceae bacterium]|nr:hypothetical protein [Dysgonamonadaceae bacterium]